MRAVRIHEFGGPEVLRVETVAKPEPKAGETLVRVTAAGVNFLDVYQRTGLYNVDLPFAPGMEGAGVVEQSANFAPGDRVAWAQHPGAYAESAVIPDEKLLPIPPGVNDETAAAVMLQGITAQYLCESTYPVKEGDRVLVHAGAGGVGLLLIQLLKHKGASVYTTVSNPRKAQLAKEAGADAAILYTETDFAATVRELTSGGGVQVVYDSVGKATYEGSLNVLKPLGMLVLFGQSSGRVPPIDPLTLTAKGSLFLTRPSLAHYIADRAALQERGQRVLGWVADGTLKVRIEKTFALEDLPKAHQELENRQTTGKLVVLM
ncbi:MAG: quinone oxidoreductase [Verrucomicrobia bacterium]|nr:quinone oxidoreductase [Verrucomicrobiota bacterium]